MSEEKKEYALIIAKYESGRSEKTYAKLRADGTLNKRDSAYLRSLKDYPKVKTVEIEYY